MEAVKSLMTAVKSTPKPSPWHSKYRTMDDLCQLIQAFRKYRETAPRSIEWTYESVDITDAAEENFIVSLIDILELEFGRLGWSFTRAVLTPGADAFGVPTFSSNHHFIYGILDLLQQHGRTTKSGKVAEKIRKAASQIVQKSPSRSFIRTKAFEVLASLRDTAPSNEMALNAIESWPDGVLQRKAKDDWRILRARVEDMNRRRDKIEILMIQSSRMTGEVSKEVANM